MIKSDLIASLQRITPEEEANLKGNGEFDRSLYMEEGESTIHSKILLEAGKLISLRKHPRFIDFPQHTHDYVELVYMYQGTTLHSVEGQEILLRKGDLLFLGQGATHSIEKAQTEDIAVNFIILPHFFADALPFIEEETPLKTFFINCLCGTDSNRFMHYQVADVPEIQNLMENLLLTVSGTSPNKLKQCQMTFALLLMQLMVNTEKMATQTKEDTAVMKLLDYIESNFADGSLKEAANLLHYEISWLSREIQRKTGKTYTALVQEKRLSQAAFLLKNTAAKVADISRSVGYENISFFHRSFFKRYGTSPALYRKQS